MAFSAERFSIISQGKTGSMALAMYDGSGSSGGDSQATIGSTGFWAGQQVVIDAIAQSSQENSASDGNGLMVIVAGNDGQRIIRLHNLGTPPVPTLTSGGTFLIT